MPGMGFRPKHVKMPTVRSGLKMRPDREWLLDPTASLGSMTMPSISIYWLDIARVKAALIWLFGRLVWQSDQFMVPR
jgi:hypothetical protein